MTLSTRLLKSLPHLSKLNSFYSDKYNYLCWKSKCLYNIYFDEYNLPISAVLKNGIK